MRLFAFLLLTGIASVRAESITPAEYRRNVEQTFLTFPEWFLVHSPAEYAAYVKDHTPSDFPFIAHVRQFWSSYGRVNEAIREYPFNFGYHVMIVVIGASTTVEYGIRSAYETLIGRVSELGMRHGLTPEDRFGAQVAQEYVDFIRVLPWYEFDFTGRLAKLWRETPMWGADPLRKWERRYALATEYAIKAVYGYLIKVGTKASYGDELLVTAVVVDKLPAGIQKDLPDLKVLDEKQNLILVPRYDAFMRYASKLAKRGANFVEIAGNRTVILVTILTRQDFSNEKLLFEQPILTQPGWKRIALVVPVAGLAAFLKSLDARGALLEHVYDY
jgi:hypothetical protein